MKKFNLIFDSLEDEYSDSIKVLIRHIEDAAIIPKDPLLSQIKFKYKLDELTEILLYLNLLLIKEQKRTRIFVG
jgi:hypothetical protein